MGLRTWWRNRKLKKARKRFFEELNDMLDEIQSVLNEDPSQRPLCRSHIANICNLGKSLGIDEGSIKAALAESRDIPVDVRGITLSKDE